MTVSDLLQQHLLNHSPKKTISNKRFDTEMVRLTRNELGKEQKKSEAGV